MSLRDCFGTPILPSPLNSALLFCRLHSTLSVRHFTRWPPSLTDSLSLASRTRHSPFLAGFLLSFESGPPAFKVESLCVRSRGVLLLRADARGAAGHIHLRLQAGGSQAVCKIFWPA